MNADGSCERRFGSGVLLDPVWRPAARLTSLPLRCVDLRLVTSIGQKVLRAGRETPFRVAIENDGNQTAIGVRLTVKPQSAQLVSGKASCRRGSCVIASIPAQGQAKLVFSVRVRRGTIPVSARVIP